MKKIHASGKRKTAIARATLKQGNGLIRINNILIDFIEPKISRLKLREPLILAGDVADKVDIDVSVAGGGTTSQAEASRLAIAKA
ncbi:MAG: 30S ribosomal protein S9, partial [Nanoarchaeota archaeon]